MSFRIGRRTPNGDCATPDRLPGGDRATPDREAWIVPPRLLTAGEGGDRHASWIELFFDLVFVVAITELSRELVLYHSPMGFLRFAALFIPVYVAWQGYMAHATLHKAAPADPDERDAPPRTVGAVHPDRARRVGRGSGGRDLRPALARGLCLGRGPRLRGRRVRLVAVLRPSGERLAARLDHVDRGVLLRAHPAAAGTGRDERGRADADRSSQPGPFRRGTERRAPRRGGALPGVADGHQNRDDPRPAPPRRRAEARRRCAHPRPARGAAGRCAARARQRAGRCARRRRGRRT